jgi:hypothetical protein
VIPKLSRRLAVRAYLACVILLAVTGLTTWAYVLGFSLSDTVFSVGIVLAILCAVARFFPINVGLGKSSFDVGSVPMFAALVLGGPLCALLVALPSSVHRDPLRTAFMAATHALQVIAGSLAFLLLAGSQPPLGDGFDGQVLLAVLGAGIAFFGVDALVSPVLVRLKYRTSWGEVVREFVLPALPSDGLALITALAMGPVATSRGPIAALVPLTGAALCLLAFDRARARRKRIVRLEQENAALGEALRSSNLDLATRLVGRLGSRDGRAASHAAASAIYARDVAREMGLDEERSQQVRLAALLQDVGLLFIPDEVLLTPPEKLNSLGKMRLENHPIVAEEVLSGVDNLGEIARWVRWHHERPDGGGYPDKLRGAWIPLESKILAATSFYASLVLDGPQAPGLSPEKARWELVGEMGEGVDEEVARAFLRVLDSERGSYALAADERFSFPTDERVVSPSPMS